MHALFVSRLLTVTRSRRGGTELCSQRTIIKGGRYSTCYSKVEKVLRISPPTLSKALCCWRLGVAKVRVLVNKVRPRRW
jgi:hypothetical protein